jgi:hypothetical protein
MDGWGSSKVRTFFEDSHITGHLVELCGFFPLSAVDDIQWFPLSYLPAGHQVSGFLSSFAVTYSQEAIPESSVFGDR